MLGLGHSIPFDNVIIAGVAIEDYMWELDGAGSLKPLAVGTITDFHDTWDANADSTELSPAAVGDVTDEGYWDLDEGSDIQPLDV